MGGDPVFEDAAGRRGDFQAVELVRGLRTPEFRRAAWLPVVASAVWARDASVRAKEKMTVVARRRCWMRATGSGWFGSDEEEV